MLSSPGVSTGAIIPDSFNPRRFEAGRPASPKTQTLGRAAVKGAFCRAFACAVPGGPRKFLLPLALFQMRPPFRLNGRDLGACSAAEMKVHIEAWVLRFCYSV
jgi:hypothetical protein